MNFKIIDAGIMNGFDTLARLGGYIMLFSMLASLLGRLPLRPEFTLLATGILELTNGIDCLSAYSGSLQMKYILAMAFTAFGGLSGIAQTSSMIRDTSLSIRHYCILKGICTGISTLLACLVAESRLFIF